MNKGRTLRFIGGFMLMFGLINLMMPDGRIQLNLMLLAVGSALSIFGMSV